MASEQAIYLSKIHKPSPKQAISPLEREIAEHLHSLGETSSTLKDAAYMKFESAIELAPAKQSDKKVVLIAFPYKIFMTYVRRNQSRLILELEKKLKRYVVCYPKRRILKPRGLKAAGMKILPRSKTLTAVHDALLEDIVGPIEIVGKRLRIRTDGSKLYKIYLDPREASKYEDKLDAYAEAYRKLTNKIATFSFTS